MKTNEPWVHASEAGQVSFCPNTVYLTTKGAKHSKASQAKMDIGTLHHEEQTNGRPGTLFLTILISVILVITVVAFILLGGIK